MSAPKLWRGQTLQDRSVDRGEQILAVAFDLLGTAGSAAVTMRAVTREASLSPRYFYESFPNREDLLIAVYDRVEDGLRDRMKDVPRELDPSATVRAALEICAGYFEEDPRRAHVLLREPLANDVLRPHSAGRAPVFVQTLAAVPGSDIDALVPGDAETLAVASTALSGSLVALYLDWVDGRLKISRERLAESATAIALAVVVAAQV